METSQLCIWGHCSNSWQGSTVSALTLSERVREYSYSTQDSLMKPEVVQILDVFHFGETDSTGMVMSGIETKYH